MRFVYNIEKCSIWNSFGGDKVNCFLFKGLTEQEKEEAVAGVVRLWNLGKVIKQNLGE